MRTAASTSRFSTAPGGYRCRPPMRTRTPCSSVSTYPPRRSKRISSSWRMTVISCILRLLRLVAERFEVRGFLFGQALPQLTSFRFFHGLDVIPLALPLGRMVREEAAVGGFVEVGVSALPLPV